jgi:hypothetical protein
LAIWKNKHEGQRWNVDRAIDAAEVVLRLLDRNRERGGAKSHLRRSEQRLDTRSFGYRLTIHLAYVSDCKPPLIGIAAYDRKFRSQRSLLRLLGRWALDLLNVQFVGNNRCQVIVIFEDVLSGPPQGCSQVWLSRAGGSGHHRNQRDYHENPDHRQILT